MQINHFLRALHEIAEQSPDGCWEWRRSVNEWGYGHVILRGRRTGAHRAAFELFVRPLAHGEFACHHCDNPACIRPDHLFAGTAADNARDREAKGRGKSSTMTHCKSGHAFTPENTRMDRLRTGELVRRCRECGRQAMRRYRERLKNPPSQDAA